MQIDTRKYITQALQGTYELMDKDSWHRGFDLEKRL